MAMTTPGETIDVDSWDFQLFQKKGRRFLLGFSIDFQQGKHNVVDFSKGEVEDMVNYAERYVTLYIKNEGDGSRDCVGYRECVNVLAFETLARVDPLLGASFREETFSDHMSEGEELDQTANDEVFVSSHFLSFINIFFSGRYHAIRNACFGKLS